MKRIGFAFNGCSCCYGCLMLGMCYNCYLMVYIKVDNFGWVYKDLDQTDQVDWSDQFDQADQDNCCLYKESPDNCQNYNLDLDLEEFCCFDYRYNSCNYGCFDDFENFGGKEYSDNYQNFDIVALSLDVLCFNFCQEQTIQDDFEVNAAYRDSLEEKINEQESEEFGSQDQVLNRDCDSQGQSQSQVGLDGLMEPSAFGSGSQTDYDAYKEQDMVVEKVREIERESQEGPENYTYMG